MTSPETSPPDGLGKASALGLAPDTGAPSAEGVAGPARLDQLIAQWDGQAPTPDRVLQRQLEMEIAQGLVVPQWVWKVPGPYNGATGEERIRGWQLTKLALQRDWLERNASCSICASRTQVHRHSELYGRPLLAKAICRDCHFQLHRRFREPEAWQALCKRHQDVRWISRIGVVELTREQARQLEQEPNPLGLLDP